MEEFYKFRQKFEWLTQKHIEGIFSNIFEKYWGTTILFKQNRQI
jgi:hypothetical protein